MRAALLVAVLLLAPRVGLACSVCMGGAEDANRAAFVGTTALLTFLPLVIIGAVVLFLRRRVRELEARCQQRARTEVARIAS